MSLPISSAFFAATPPNIFLLCTFFNFSSVFFNKFDYTIVHGTVFLCFFSSLIILYKGTALFNSLLLCIQMMFSFMLTDDDSSLKVCKHCGKAFAATRSNMEFCSPQCKNQYNVYKSRAKKNNTPAQDD